MVHHHAPHGETDSSGRSSLDSAQARGHLPGGDLKLQARLVHEAWGSGAGGHAALSHQSHPDRHHGDALRSRTANHEEQGYIEFSSPYENHGQTDLAAHSRESAAPASDTHAGLGTAALPGELAPSKSAANADLSSGNQAMKRLVEASLGTPGHQGAADYERYTLHHGSMGYCAGGVEEAIRRAGLGNFHADARYLGGLLAKSPHWQEVQVPASELKHLPAGYVVTMKDRAGDQHAFISDGNGRESSDWIGSTSKDQLIPLVLAGKATYQVFKPVDSSSKSTDAPPTPSPTLTNGNSGETDGDGTEHPDTRHHGTGSSQPFWSHDSDRHHEHSHRHHEHHHSGEAAFHRAHGANQSSFRPGYEWMSGSYSQVPAASFSDTNTGTRTNTGSDTSSTPTDTSSAPPGQLNQSWLDFLASLGIGDPNSYFMNQFRSKYNPDGLSRSEDCGPTSLAMFMLHTGHFPPGVDGKDTAKLIKAVRIAMTGSAAQSGTTESQVMKGASAAGIPSHIVKGMSGLDSALAKGEMVVAEGNPGAKGAYGSTLSNSQYSHFNGSHFILVVAHQGDKYVINDPLSRRGSIVITAAQMKAYLQGDGGAGSGVALGG